jgi:hypothetical protein
MPRSIKLGALAKSTGGIGLRSAIKVIQDILIEDSAGQPPVADREVGWLATTVTLYDSLDRDIRRAFPSVHQAVDKVLNCFRDDPLAQSVGKTIAVLQILGNMPVTVQNVASLMHPSVDSASLAERVKEAVEALLKDSVVPLGEEKDGSLRFFSEKLNDVDQERTQLAPRGPDFRRIFNDTLRDVFDPLPSARLNGTLTVTSGVRHLSGGQTASLAGEREVIQTVVVFADPAEYEAERLRLLDESRHKSSENVVYLLGRTVSDQQERIAEIYRCSRIVELHRNDPDQEVKEYCASQTERTARQSAELGQRLSANLMQGSFVFRGSSTAAESHDPSLLSACKKHLGDAAERIFDHYPEAPERAPTELTERFLRAAGANLRTVPSTLDPLSLVQITGSSPSIDTSRKALVSIRDRIERNGTIEGKGLLDAFSAPPFGWSPDTTRYLVAALLVAGEIKLKVSGREVTVNGQQAIDVLKTNNSFRAVGVSLRQDRPSMDVLARAAERLTDLSGDQVVPLEDEIGRAAQKLLPTLQHRLAPLGEKLASLRLPGTEMVESVNQQIADLMLSDASDAPQRFGAEQSSLYDGLKWAIAARTALDQGLGDTVRDLRNFAGAIDDLPSTGILGELRESVREDLETVADRLAQDDFVRHKADLASGLTTLSARVADAVRAMARAQAQRLRDAEQDLELLPEWSAFTAEEQSNALAELQAPAATVGEGVAGLKKMIARQYDIEQTITDLKTRVVRDAHARLLREREAVAGGGFREPAEKARRPLPVPARIATAAELDALIRRLQALRIDLPYTEFDIVIGEG